MSDLTTSAWFPALILIAVLVYLAVTVWKDTREYSAFKNSDETPVRIAYFRKWWRKGFFLYTLLPLLILTLLGRGEVLSGVPLELSAARDSLTGGVGSSSAAVEINLDDLSLPFVLGVLFAFVIGVLFVAVLTKAIGKSGAAGDFEPLLPRNARERWPVLLLSLNAGVGEEFFFRAMLPLLFVLAGMPPVPALWACAAIFGLVHVYQGWLGVLVTGVLGMGLSYLYLKSDAIWYPMALHVLVNLNALFLRPALARLVGRIC